MLVRINMIANHEIKPNLQFLQSKRSVLHVLQSKRSVLHVLLSLIVYIPFPKQGGCLEPQEHRWHLSTFALQH